MSSRKRDRFGIETPEQRFNKAKDLLIFLLRFPFKILKLVLWILRAAFTFRFVQTNYQPSVGSRLHSNLRFEVRGQRVHLNVTAAGTYSIEMEWTNSLDRFDLRLEEFETKGIRRRGMEKIDLADPGMNHRLLVYSNVKPVVVQLMFDRQTRRSLEDIIEFREVSELQVLIYSGKFVVKKKISKDLGRQTAELVRLVISLRNFMVNSMQGNQVYAEAAIDDGSIEFLNIVDSSDDRLVETACQVCGQTLDNDLVSCLSCKTLHHRDCWEYNGRCTTFGCRQSQYEGVE